MNATLELRRRTAAALRPDPELTVSEWADRDRYLTPKESPEPGIWRTSRVPYLRGIMDLLSASSPVQRVVFMKGAQVGASEAGLNFCGYVIGHVPGPMLIVQPTVELAERFSKQRVASMIAASPPLTERVQPARSRDSGNTILGKEFPGGILILAGANSAAGLRSMPVRDLMLDEIDAYPDDVEGEGDPAALAEQRTANFRRRKVFVPSTPTRKGFSRIEREFEASDQRFWWVPCQDCGEFQRLEWEQVKWPEGEPEDAAYVCRHCGCLWDYVARVRSVQQGEWRASRPFHGTAGFHISALYSPWVRIPDLARRFERSKGRPEERKTFWNTVLGLPWEEQAAELDPMGVYGRREFYAADPLPELVVLLTAGVDVQTDRIEVEIVGWGRDEERWSLDYRVLRGDTSAKDVWERLDEELSRSFQHPWGETLRIAASAVDSGYQTQTVYRFAAARKGRRVWAVKGVPGDGKPIWGRPSKWSRGKSRVFPVGVDTAKSRIYARLQIPEPGPGYCHFPTRYDLEHFKQLTAERIVTQYHRGFPRRVWVKRPEQRNEPLDCAAYAVAALEGLDVHLGRVADGLRKRAEDRGFDFVAGRPAPPKNDGPPPRPRRPRRSGGGGWVTRF